MMENCLAKSRFIAFFDECGDHSLSKIDKDFPLFLLCTVIVERRASFYRLMTQGTYYNSAERFQKLVCPISFRRKQDNICGIQVADLCAHPTARHLLKPDIANQAFEVVKPHIYVSGRINGLKVHPK